GEPHRAEALDGHGSRGECGIEVTGELLRVRDGYRPVRTREALAHLVDVSRPCVARRELPAAEGVRAGVGHGIGEFDGPPLRTVSVEALPEDDLVGGVARDERLDVHR